MDYSYYPTAQMPYQYSGLSVDSNGGLETSHPGEWTGSTSPANNNFNLAFDTFVQSVNDRHNYVPPQARNYQQSLQHSPVSSLSPSNSLRQNGHKVSLSEPNISPSNGVARQNSVSEPPGEEVTSRTRSSSEERESLTPAQNKRKAQNRAAQRAFRERKERHVKELEAKLNDMEQGSASLRDENERLKREIAKITTENEILKATSSFGPLPHSTQGRRSSTRQDDEILKTGPMKYTPTDFTPSLTSTHSDNLHHQNRPSQHSSHSQLHSSLPSSSSPVLSSQSSTHRITISPLTGRRLLSAGAVWDFIQAHELVKDGLADITDVTARLKEAAECDGTGPAFEEGKLVRAIEESAGVS